MYSVTGQIEDRQVSHQHCPPRVLFFEIGQPIINVKRFSRLCNETQWCHPEPLYLHVGYYRILRKK